MKHVLKNIRYMLKQVRGAHRGFLPVCLLVQLAGVVSPLTSVLGLKVLFDALTGGVQPLTLAAVAGVYGLVNGGYGVLMAWYQNSYLPVAKVKIQGAVSSTLMRKAASLDLANFDDATFYNRYTRAINEANTRAVDVAETVCAMAGNVLSIAVLATMILVIEPVVLLCSLVGVAISLVFDLIRARMQYRCDLETTPYNRRLSYIQRIFYEPQYAKELRLFRMGTPGMRKYLDENGQLAGVLRRQGRKRFALQGAERFVNEGLFVGVALIYLGWRALTGAIGIGSLSAMFNAAFQFGGQLNSFVSKFPALYQHSLFIDNLLAVLSARSGTEPGGPLLLDPSRPHSITLQGVSFSYGSGKAALSGVSLHVGAGEKVAVVGYNGAGKSTLVKLMTRLYDPDAGRVLLDGVDIREYSAESLRSGMGVVMQDFQHYAFSLAENVKPGFVPGEETGVRNALKFAGLSERVEKLPKGIHSPITREFESDGVMMSGGEFQKLSLARAWAQDAHVLILDELSSALDPVAEYELNQAILQAVRDRTVVFISHRLSATRMADRIYLMEGGCVAEEGTHDQLMQRGGKYALLYRMQAEKYAG